MDSTSITVDVLSRDVRVRVLTRTRVTHFKTFLFAFTKKITIYEIKFSFNSTTFILIEYIVLGIFSSFSTYKVIDILEDRCLLVCP